jgi:hypothetical protein
VQQEGGHRQDHLPTSRRTGGGCGDIRRIRLGRTPRVIVAGGSPPHREGQGLGCGFASLAVFLAVRTWQLRIVAFNAASSYATSFEATPWQEHRRVPPTTGLACFRWGGAARRPDRRTVGCSAPQRLSVQAGQAQEPRLRRRCGGRPQRPSGTFPVRLDSAAAGAEPTARHHPRTIATHLD